MISMDEIKNFDDLAAKAIKLQKLLANRGIYMSPRECVFLVLKQYREDLIEQGLQEVAQEFDENFTEEFLQNFLSSESVDLMIN